MKKKGFGLLETSLTITIISFMTISSLTLYNLNHRKNLEKLEKLKERYYITKIEQLDTRSRLNKIYKAIKFFVIHNNRLPCPDSDGDGNENITTSCAGSTITGTDIKYADIPYLSLGLSKELSLDEWNNNFQYYVDERFAKASYGSGASDGFAAEKTMHDINNSDSEGRIDDPDPKFEIINVTSDGTNSIAPKDGLNSNIRPNASYLFIIVSGGSDGINSENSGNNNIFIDDGSDIIIFKNKQEILQDANIDNFFCSKKDSKIIFNDSGNLGSCATGEIEFNNTIHSKNIYNKADCPCGNNQKIIRKCQEYGIWQNIELMTQNQCMN